MSTSASPVVDTRVHLRRDMFHEGHRPLVTHGELSVMTHRYPTGIEALTLSGPRGQIVVLPYLGQIVWDAQFDGVTMTMHSMFSQPRPAETIVDTYGCFAFHSGLLSAGCPGPDDDHPLHGEMACAAMDSAWLDLTEAGVTVGGSVEWVKGFGHHYVAKPSVAFPHDEAAITIGMEVTNLSGAASMPLQYMCHLNHAYLPQATFGGTLPQEAFGLRTSVPEHVHPTPDWSAFTAAIQRGDEQLDALDRPTAYDPEIVFFADDVRDYGERIVAECSAPDGPTFYTEFDSREFPVATRWILHNPDQQVAAYCLPGTSRPEGRSAADAAGTLISLAPGCTRRFTVTTGVRA